MGNTNLTTKEMQRFYKNVIVGLNDNIIIDQKLPRGRNENVLNRSHIFINIEHHENEEDEDILKEKKINLNLSENSLHGNHILNKSNTSGVSNLSKNEEKEEKKYFYKSPSIEKNINKYPIIGSNELKVEDENKKYTDPLTVQQDHVPNNLRGKKYYMNYLNNIIDKDLKVKDNFKIDHWKGEILGKQIKYIRKK